MSLRAVFYSVVGVAGTLMSAEALSVTLSQVYGSNLTKQTQTLSVSAEAGWTTYSSEAAGSNATGPSMTYSIAGYAGESRVLGIEFTSTNVEMPFELNKSRVTTRQQDLKMVARWQWFYPHIVVSQSDNRVSLDEVSSSEADGIRLKQRSEETVCDYFGNSIGGGLGVYAPITDSIVVHADASVMRGTSASDRNGKKVEEGMRQDVEIGTNVDLTDNMLDLVMGYKLRNFEVEVEGESFKESQSTPYAGLQLGVYF